MPPLVKVTREAILEAAVELVRQGGPGMLNARAIATKLGCSTQPVFSNYATMEALRRDVIRRGMEIWQARTAQAMKSGEYPPYKASGMAYIRFAREEKELFRLCFMRPRQSKEVAEGSLPEAVVAVIMEGLGLTREEALAFHLQMWIYVHGIATMLATGYLDWDEETAGNLLTEAYQGARLRLERKREAK